jgi:hypothetical protein
VYRKIILPQFFHLSNSLKTRFKRTRREYELHMGILSSQNIVYLGFSFLGVYNWITLKYISGFSPKIYIYIYIYILLLKTKRIREEEKTEMAIYAQGNV